MPVIIKELIIKAVVEETPNGGNSGGSGTAKSTQEQEELIATCVEQVLEILEKSKNR
jgi:hypothetical protein